MLEELGIDNARLVLLIVPEMAIDGKDNSVKNTPAELAGIQVAGKNKWLTIIQDASTKF